MSRRIKLQLDISAGGTKLESDLLDISVEGADSLCLKARLSATRIEEFAKELQRARDFLAIVGDDRLEATLYLWINEC